MSNATDNQQQQTEQELDSDFEAGLLDVEQVNDTQTDSAQKNDDGNTEQGGFVPQDPTPEQAYQAQQQLAAQAQAQQLAAQQAAAQQAAHEQASQQARQEREAQIQEELAEELAELKALNPQAVALALEDSADGQMMRDRLATYGAVSAQDRADIILYKRQHEQAVAQAQVRQTQDYNNNFQSVIQREIPEVWEMSNDPSRAAETAALKSNLKSWIESKPYGEAAPMMETYLRGSDPNEVAKLFKDYFADTGAGATKKSRFNSDLSGGYAPPSGTNNLSPKGLGDKNSFEAGMLLEL